MPNFSPLERAYSRQSSRTTQPRHTSLASRVDAPRSGKNRSGSTPRQLARSCQLCLSTSSVVSFIGLTPRVVPVEGRAVRFRLPHAGCHDVAGGGRHTTRGITLV